MKKTVIFVLLPQYAEWEAAYLASALAMLGKGALQTRVAGLSREAVESIGGFHTLPDYALDELPADFDALILIGGMAWRSDAARRVEPVVKSCLEAGKLVGGICDAAGFLGTTGALNRVRHTANDLEDLRRWAGATYTGEALYVREQAVRDENIVTANGTAALEFAREVLLALEAVPEGKVEEWYAFHKLGFYGAPMPDMG